MENQLHTQPQSSELKMKNKVINSIKENLNYIYIVLMIIVNILLGLLTIEDGQIGLNYPHTVLGWVLWCISIFLQTLIGVLILNAFRRQGIKIGHETIKETYEEYKKACLKDKEKNPRSLKEYLTREGVKDSLTKSLIYIILSVFVGSVVIGANLNNILSLITNIVFAVGFGIKTMIDAEEFVVMELVLWYQLKIAEVTDHNKTEPAKEKNNENIKRRLSRNNKSPKHRRASGVQQKEECGAGPETFNNECSSPNSN